MTVDVEEHQPVAGTIEMTVEPFGHAERADGGIDHGLPGDDRRQLLDAPGFAGAQQ